MYKWSVHLCACQLLTFELPLYKSLLRQERYGSGTRPGVLATSRLASESAWSADRRHELDSCYRFVRFSSEDVKILRAIKFR